MIRFTRYLVAILLVFSVQANAQFTPGTRIVGASVGSIFLNSGDADQTVTNIGSRTVTLKEFGVNISPSLGWFVSENTAVGFTVNVNTLKKKTSFEEGGSTYQKDNASNLDIGIGGFARNYFGSSGSFLPFGQFGFGVGMSSSNTDGFLYTGSIPNVTKETYEGKGSGGFFADALLTAGFTKMVGKYTGLDFYLGYNYHYSKNTVKTTRLIDIGNDGGVPDETRIGETISKFTNHRFILGVGFQVFLEKKKKK